MNYLFRTIILILTICLSACASKPAYTSNSQHNLYRPATKLNTDSNVVVGKNSMNSDNNVKKLFYSDSQNKTINGIAAVKLANQKSVIQPSSDNTFNSIVIFQYQPGDLYQIYTTPLNVTDIEFQAGEKIISVAAGDTMRWQVSKTIEGFGKNSIEHLLIKPLSKEINTTLVVMTNERTYHLLLKSTQNTFMVAVKWLYDEQQGMMLTNLTDHIPDENLSFSESLQSLNFSYQLKLVKGKKPTWTPVAIFDDGHKTYIEFPSNMQASPDLFIKQDGNDASVNYRVVNNYYVVDQLIQQAELVSDNGKTIVRIFRKY